ncbi:MAG: hypothetical protein B6I17_03300 [Tenericutes bacterium 4572_104]|nr:MAG: hypothetical protein B6I17_03300 [Tenericutes bacterium 4572_104]
MLCYFIKNENYSLDIYQDNSYKNINTTVQKYLNEKLKNSLTDLASREKVTKKIFHFEAKIPLFINNNELLMCIKSYRLEKSCYINYFSIKYYYEKDNEIIIEFYENHSLKTQHKYTFYEQIKRCKQIIEFLNL